MLLPSAFYPHAECIAKHLPHLRSSQVRGLALWVGATILARSGCQNAVLGALLPLGLGWHTTRQYLREWLRDGVDRAVDPTAKGEPLVVLVVSVVYRGLWMPDLCNLLDRLGPVVPSAMTVRVLCDRGLQSPDLWAAIRRQGWHPYMRYDRHMTFQAATGPRWPAWRFVAHEGQ